MTSEELERLEALANAATGGSWQAGDPYDGRTALLVSVYGMGMEVADTQREADAAFIAAARDAVPSLIAEVRRLRERVATVDAEREQAYQIAQQNEQTARSMARVVEDVRAELDAATALLTTSETESEASALRLLVMRLSLLMHTIDAEAQP